MTRLLRSSTLLVGLTIAVGCSDGGDPAGPGRGDSPMTARIDGQQWRAASTPGATLAMRLAPNNFLSITGTSPGLMSVNLTIHNVTGTGTYSLTAAGSLGFVSAATGTPSWVSTGAGSSGSATITVLNAERVAGTFAFTAIALTGSPSNTTVQVTNGEFDMAWTGESGF